MTGILKVERVCFFANRTAFPVRAVLFDFDGVLADTMHDNFIAWQYAFRQQTINILPDDYFPYEGHGPRELVAIIGERYSLRKVLYNKVIQDKERYYLQRNKFRFYRGAKALVCFLASRNVALGLVSGASPERLYKVLPEKIARCFSCIIDATSVKKNKPDPSPYLFCLRKMGMSPNGCIAIENSPLGIISAKHAGLFCVGICSTLSSHKLQDADIIVKNMAGLRAHLE